MTVGVAGEEHRQVADLLGAGIDRRLAAFIDGPYRARAVPHVGVGQYPGGPAYYAYLIRRHTSLRLTPGEIHQIGLDEIARLEGQLDDVRAAAGFSGSLDAFRRHLKTDPRELRKKAEAALGSAFDLRRFHEHVLRPGPMPIAVLEQHVRCFIEEKHRTPPGMAF